MTTLIVEEGRGFSIYNSERIGGRGRGWACCREREVGKEGRRRRDYGEGSFTIN
jgi:hypothetical protein